MRHLILTFLFASFVLAHSTLAQLPDGATAPDWTHNDIFANQHHLYSLLDQGKMVVLKFSATWCGPCWNYMQTGALETFWNQHGPNGTNLAQAFYIESDQNTGLDDLYGNTPGSQGNWVAEIPFPIIDLQVGENTDNLYQIIYYPTLYAVCPDRTVYELGQVPASVWSDFITSCGLAATVTNIVPATCFGQGSATIGATGGITPITYQWSNGATGPILQNVGAGTYSVTVTEALGKFVKIEDIVIPGAAAPVALASSNIDPALCYSSATGAVSVQLANGVQPYSYQWSNGSQTQNLVNVTAGTYTLNATDANGCPYSGSFVVPQPQELVADHSTTPEYCNQVNGTVELEISGGVGNYTISASEGVVQGNFITSIPSGNVNITVEDGNGCEWTESINIEFEPEHLVYFSPDPTITCEENVAIITGYVNGGSGDYEFAWSTMNGNINGPTNQPSIEADQIGQYDLIVYDLTTGCIVENNIDVDSAIDPPVITAGEDTAVTCELQLIMLQGIGDPEFMASWTTPDGNIVSGNDTYTPTIDAPGIYYLQVINPENACTNVDSVIVNNEMYQAQAAFQSQTNDLVFTGTDASTGSGLSGWTWNFGDGNTSMNQNAIHTYDTAGIYMVCLSVQNGCGVSEVCQSIEITSTGAVLHVEHSVQHVLCHGDSTGSIIIQVTGGSGNYTYAWTGPNGELYSTPTIEFLLPGLYQVLVTDEFGNSFAAEYLVTQPEAIILVGSTVVDNLCFGDTNGSILIEVTGGVGPYLYSFNGGPFQPLNMLSNLSGGMIDGIIVDANGCPFPAGPYTIDEPQPIQVDTFYTADATGPLHDNGSITISVSGGVAPYMIAWSNGSTGSTIEGLIPGNYTYTITDANGCTLGVSDPVVIHGLVSTGNVDWSSHILVSPNPSKGNAMITWKDLDFQYGQLTLFTPEGKHVQSMKLVQRSGQWDLSNLKLSTGLFILLLEIDQQVIPIKIIIL